MDKKTLIKEKNTKEGLPEAPVDCSLQSYYVTIESQVPP